MPRSLWTGSLSFGLVNIPVKLYSAVSQKDIRFHLLHDSDGVRLRQKRICPVHGEEVSNEHIVKGYEIAPDHYVVVKPDELEALDPKATQSIDIQDFVSLTQIDPLYFEHAYYLVPTQGAQKAYSLLLEAMNKAKKVAVARFVMRGKEYLAAVRPLDRVLALETMLFADEVVSWTTLPELPEGHVDVGERELAMAKQLIDTLTSDFHPEKYHDAYRARVMELIERKAEGQEIVAQPEQPKQAKVINLMEALEASLAASKNKAPPKAANEPTAKSERKERHGRRRKA
jgi:DNA end-binding protein Ku